MRHQPPLYPPLDGIDVCVKRGTCIKYCDQPALQEQIAAHNLKVGGPVHRT
jgi:hypothetical protein